MELEESIKELNAEMKYLKSDINEYPNARLLQAIETVLKALEESIPKKVIEDKIEKLKMQSKLYNKTVDEYEYFYTLDIIQGLQDLLKGENDGN